MLGDSDSDVNEAGSPIRALQAACGVPVSVVIAGAPPVIEAETPPDPSTALDRVVEASPGYRWDRPRGRYTLYPASEPWHAPVRGLAISQRPRIDAAERLITEIGRQVPELGDLAGVIQKGDPRSAVFEAPVTVTGDAPALEHLAALLGDDERLAFAIDRGTAGGRVLWFEQVGAEETE